MELSSRQIVALAAPLIITYLTWSTLQGQMKTLAQATSNHTGVVSRSRDDGGPKAPLRDPFSPLTAQAVLHAGGEEDEEVGETLVLNATVIVPDWRMAVINGERVYEGQRFRGLHVRKVEPQRVLLQGEEGAAVELPLQVAIVVQEEKKDAPPVEEHEFLDELFPGHAGEMTAGPAAGLPPGVAPIMPVAIPGLVPSLLSGLLQGAAGGNAPGAIANAQAAAAMMNARQQQVVDSMMDGTSDLEP